MSDWPLCVPLIPGTAGLNFVQRDKGLAVVCVTKYEDLCRQKKKEAAKLRQKYKTFLGSVRMAQASVEKATAQLKNCVDRVKDKDDL